jgi:hypothetical protein
MPRSSKMSEMESMIQPVYQPDPESLVDSIAFGPDSKLEEWNNKLQTMKQYTPESCDKARDLYKGIASGIKGERRWKSPGRRMDAAKALMLSDKLQWIPEKCNRASLKKKLRRKKTKGKGTKRKGTKHHKKSKMRVSKHNMMGGKRSKKAKKSRRGKKRKHKQSSKKR